MANLNDEIKAYERMQPELEAKHRGRWVLIKEGELVSVHDTFEAAADEAVEKFGRGPYLIRQVGAAPGTLPVSVMLSWHAES
jgi:hypothetical protein